MKKFQKYQYNRSVVPLLVILDDFAGHALIENKRTPLAKMLTKCRHYNTTFIIAVQTAKYVIKDIRRQMTDGVVWAGHIQCLIILRVTSHIIHNDLITNKLHPPVSKKLI